MPKKSLTPDNINQRLNPRGIFLVGEFTGRRAPALFQCTKGHTWRAQPKFVLNGSGCAQCQHDLTRNSKEIVNRRLLDRGIVMIGDYTNALAKTLFKCPMGHEWSTTPSRVLGGKGCPVCSGNSPEQSKKDFIQRVIDFGCMMVGEYRSSLKRVEIICPKGHAFNQLPSLFKNGPQCPRCSNTSPHYANEKLLQTAFERGYTVLGKYTGMANKIEMKCPEGHLIKIAAASFVSGCGCGGCAHRDVAIAGRDFEKTVSQRGYSLIGEYRGSRHKIEMKCALGHPCKISPADFRSGVGCIKCAIYGFKPFKPSVFYLYTLARDEFTGLGFGITNNLKIRDKQHRTIFKKTGVRGVLVGTLSLADGYEIVKLESQLKAHHELIDFGIKGFRSECLPLDLKDEIISQLNLLGSNFDTTFDPYEAEAKNS